MARSKKPGHYFNCKLEQSVYNGLDKLCKDTGLEKTVVVERALRMFIEDYHGYIVNSDGTRVPKVSLEDYVQES